MFRNVRLYRLASDWPASEEALSEELEKAGFAPCGPLTERSTGWIAIDEATSPSLARRVNGADLMRLRTQSRVLPTAAINEALEEKIETYRSRMQEDPPPREKRRMKAETREKLMTQALLKSDRTWGYVDIKEKILVIDANSPTAAERFLQNLMLAFGNIDLRPVKFQKSLGDLLRKLFLGEAPARFNVGRECRMQDATDAGAYVRWADFDLGDPTIRKHVADGMRLTHLAIEYDHVLSCVIDEHGVLSKLRFLGMDDKDEAETNDSLGRFDASFVLLTGTLRQMLGDLKNALGGYE